ncbi:hypothetical protein PoB_006437900 [Plakobranchus ocellatus]|uniref:Uncharacterized protein n=1 Tax=Plakobranchus ocellatus TaxID=259542 RepID=A0AAV4D131_9GAST|nr:hypothetical protein PoB_006437900 [Plakobranchus ocellatus]
MACYNNSGLAVELRTSPSWKSTFKETISKASMPSVGPTVAELEPATKESLRISGWVRYPLCHRKKTST